MTQTDDLHASIAASIHHDATGPSVAQFHAHLLRSAYQPTYRLDSNQMTIAGSRALVRPARAGRPSVPVRLFDRLGPADRLRLECLCRALHVANLPHLELPTGSLSMRIDATGGSDDVETALVLLRRAVTKLEDEGRHPPLISCELACTKEEASRERADILRRHGFRVALRDFGPDIAGVEIARAVQPDYVRVDGNWFRPITRMPDVLKLFASVISVLHADGIEVLADGIETPAELEAALETGADLFQGFLFSPPVLAGAKFIERPLGLPQLLHPRARIIPLRRPA
ncbi:EAL domain-containing protein [Aliihoeflea aestuarii]|jgi:EAL domain-containing protein (putative c-di-GMP-specific phosphodiesterase class I)|uniref:EAL domain-containing protein n=1 Tax=Aliihoeflea aestuarii TaxID=453840 RepID=UPI0020956922|nr:EAL domain-containing protein [Aliihoeflea aestuarii]MCO6393022.1 EAL domain-containing protein [Aliihoeflea aestuarii]